MRKEMMNGRNLGQGDYEEGDTIVYKTRMGEKRTVEVERKSLDMNPCDEHDNRSGFDAVLISTTERDTHLEEGDGVWGYDNQVVRVK